MGVKLRVWRQGQFYPELGKKVIELPYDVNPGPSDNQIEIEGFNVQPDVDGNFLAGNYTADEEDAINTYGTARQVIDLYENLLGQKIKWSWQKEGIDKPLRIRIRNNDINARFLKKQRCIELDFYGNKGQIVYNCRTVDIIAHEIGHAILDSLLPRLNGGSVEQQGIGEAFCDLTAMFLILNQLDLCGFVIFETAGNLNKKSIISNFGYGHNHSVNSLRIELRNANNKRIISHGSNSYDYCDSIVGSFYDILEKDFSDSNGQSKDLPYLLSEVGVRWTKFVFDCYLMFERVDGNSEFQRFVVKDKRKNFDNLLRHLKNRKIL